MTDVALMVGAAVVAAGEAPGLVEKAVEDTKKLQSQSDNTY
jgi:hypothetical protein